jgi:hypothetical protein
MTFSICSAGPECNVVEIESLIKLVISNKMES